MILDRYFLVKLKPYVSDVVQISIKKQNVTLSRLVVSLRFKNHFNRHTIDLNSQNTHDCNKRNLRRMQDPILNRALILVSIHDPGLIIKMIKESKRKKLLMPMLLTPL